MKRPKNPNPAKQEKHENLRNGIRERAKSWGGKPIEKRSDIKRFLKDMYQ